MNEKIISNLFELWHSVGNTLGSLTVTDNFLTVSVDGSDWPNRVFDVGASREVLQKVVALAKNKDVPAFIALNRAKHTKLLPGLDLYMSQLNMSVPLSQGQAIQPGKHDIVKVNTLKEALMFAQTASAAFGYRIDYRLILKLTGNSQMHLYFLLHQKKAATCGLLFFDRNNNAGLHMIGTLPGFRNKGFGKAMTMFLMHKAQEKNKENAVLQASVMGEPIYRKLGYTAFGFMDTYQVKITG